jgi:hypothetical protein
MFHFILHDVVVLKQRHKLSTEMTLVTATAHACTNAWKAIDVC